MAAVFNLKKLYRLQVILILISVVLALIIFFGLAASGNWAE